MKEKIKAWAMPVLVALLLGAVFYIGRLSSKLEQAEKGNLGTAKVVATPTVVADSPLMVNNLKKMAVDLGMNGEDFNKCLDEGKMTDRVNTDQKYGTTLGVSGTPTFFINGLMVVGAMPTENFEEIIDAEIKNGGGAKLVGDLMGEKNPKRVELEQGKGYMVGGKNAKVKIIEFTDFQCPYCNRVISTIKDIEEKYSDQVSIEVRNFPLGFHQYAPKAAEASLCAGEQGKFWEMHDAMFEAMASFQG